MDSTGYAMDHHAAMREVAAAGLRSLERLVLQFSLHQPPSDCRDIADQIAKFKDVISVLKRTGHARFRRGPQPAAVCAPLPANASPPATATRTETLDFTKTKSMTSSSFLSSLTGGNGRITGKEGYSCDLVPSTGAAASVTHGGKTPLACSHKRKDAPETVHSAGDLSGGRCHCTKKRYVPRQTARASPFPRSFLNCALSHCISAKGDVTKRRCACRR